MPDWHAELGASVFSDVTEHSMRSPFLGQIEEAEPLAGGWRGECGWGIHQARAAHRARGAGPRGPRAVERTAHPGRL